MCAAATWSDSSGNRKRFNGRLRRVVMLAVFTLWWLWIDDPLQSFTNPGSENEVQRRSPVYPIVIQHGQKDIVPAIHQSMMLHRNVLCTDLAKLQKNNALPATPESPVCIYFRMNCQQLFLSNKFGTGNIVKVFYNIRLIARLLGNVEIKMECTDAMDTRSDLVMPWLMGTFAATSPTNVTQNTTMHVCEKFQPATAPVMVDAIQYELRRMAISLVGIPQADHPAAQFIVEKTREREMQVPMSTKPFFPNVELDDVAIHFRCGDIIERKAHPNYSYVRWKSLARLISPQAKSIGIITQPFEGQSRKVDQSNKNRCPRLVQALQTYLKQQFPQAQVSLRNSPTENIALSFTRLIMANQSLAGGVSTFYQMPFYAAFGTTYDAEYHRANNDTISSERIMELWNQKNALQQIVKLFTT